MSVKPKQPIALITGANQGIGAAIAKKLAAQNCAVLISYFRLPNHMPPDAPTDKAGQALHDAQRATDASAVVDAIRAAGGQAEMVEIDLAKPENIPTLMNHVETAFGGAPHILVNNAAAWKVDMLRPQATDEDHTQEAYRQHHLFTAASHDFHFAVNSRAAVLLMVELAKRNTSGWGRIINLSTGGAAGFPGEVSYGASKAALESYSRAAAQELGYLGITVNVIVPGPTQTGWITEDLAQDFTQRTALGRVGHPDDIANAVSLLCSEDAAWITGQVIHANGGFR